MQELNSLAKLQEVVERNPSDENLAVYTIVKNILKEELNLLNQKIIDSTMVIINTETEDISQFYWASDIQLLIKEAREKYEA